MSRGSGWNNVVRSCNNHNVLSIVDHEPAAVKQGAADQPVRGVASLARLAKWVRAGHNIRGEDLDQSCAVDPFQFQKS